MREKTILFVMSIMLVLVTVICFPLRTRLENMETRVTSLADATTENIDEEGFIIMDSESLQKDISVPNESFQLVVSVNTGKEGNWDVTETNRVNIETKTKGLPNNTKVYIDSLSSEAVFKSIITQYDEKSVGKTESSLRNELLPGIPISNSSSYVTKLEVKKYVEENTKIKMEGADRSYAKRKNIYGVLIRTKANLLIQEDGQTVRQSTVFFTVLIPIKFKGFRYLGNQKLVKTDIFGKDHPYIYKNKSFKKVRN